MTEKFHCIECAGHAAAKGEKCFTCDGAGNPLKAQPVPKRTKKKRRSS